jgi:hypothetical protein
MICGAPPPSRDTVFTDKPQPKYCCVTAAAQSPLTELRATWAFLTRLPSVFLLHGAGVSFFLQKSAVLHLRTQLCKQIKI